MQRGRPHSEINLAAFIELKLIERYNIGVPVMVLYRDYLAACSQVSYPTFKKYLMLIVEGEADVSNT